MDISGVIQQVPGGVHWEVDLPSTQTDWSYWSDVFRCGPIKCAINFTNMLDSSCDVCVRFVILEVPGKATFSRLIRWQMDMNHSVSPLSYYSMWQGDSTHGLRCIMNAEKIVTGGYLGVAQEVFLERAVLECQHHTRLTFILRVKVEGFDTDILFPMETKAPRAEKTQVSHDVQAENKSFAATAKEGCGSNAKDKTQVSFIDQSQDGNDSRLSDQDIKALLTLQKHFKELLLSGDDQDVIIKVNNREFRAHRSVLRTRSSVFAAMFRSEMKESADGTITIKDCDQDAFGEFLEYVYTGKVQNLSTGNALELYYAGDKYDFPELKEACVEFLTTSLSTTTVSEVISLATKHEEQELLKSAMAFFAGHLVEILVTVEWQRFLLANPVWANEICLKAIKDRLNKK